jgi:hypothetical protein
MWNNSKEFFAETPSVLEDIVLADRLLRVNLVQKLVISRNHRFWPDCREVVSEDSNISAGLPSILWGSHSL